MYICDMWKVTTDMPDFHNLFLNQTALDQNQSYQKIWEQKKLLCVIIKRQKLWKSDTLTVTCPSIDHLAITETILESTQTYTFYQRS